MSTHLTVINATEIRIVREQRGTWNAQIEIAITHGREGNEQQTWLNIHGIDYSELPRLAWGETDGEAEYASWLEQKL